MVAVRHDVKQEILLPPQLVHGLRLWSDKDVVRLKGSPGEDGFGLPLVSHILRLVEGNEQLVVKAVNLACLCSYLADHIELVVPDAILLGCELNVDDERPVWDCLYHSAVTTFARRACDEEKLLGMMGRLKGYARVSLDVHGVRERHWSLIQRMKIFSHQDRHAWIDPETTLRDKIEAVMTSRRSPKAKARMIRLAASLLADLDAPSNGAIWRARYARVMIDLYRDVAKHSEVLGHLVDPT